MFDGSHLSKRSLPLCLFSVNGSVVGKIDKQYVEEFMFIFITLLC